MQPTNRRAFERDRALARLSRLTSLTAVAGMVGTVGFGGLAALNFRGTVTTTTDANQNATDPSAATDTANTTDDSGQTNPYARATNPPTTQLQPTIAPVRVRTPTRPRVRVVTGGSG
jgi:hypothetical protein